MDGYSWGWFLPLKAKICGAGYIIRNTKEATALISKIFESSINMTRVLVTNAKSRTAYNVVSSLGARGIKVYTSDFVRRSMAFASRYSQGHFLYPSPYSNQEEFIHKIIETIQRLKIDVLIPVSEETYLISKFKPTLSSHVRMVLPDYDKILIAHNKDRWTPVARGLGIAVPKSIEIDALQNGGFNSRDLRYPVLIKPKQGGGGWGIRNVGSADELDDWLRLPQYENRAWHRFFVQEKIIGESICVALLMNAGELRAKVAYKQLRDYPISGGQATLRESIHNETAEAQFQQILEHIGWHGVCQADFIVDKYTHTPYLIDINPRLWGSLAQAVACGVDFPYLIYKIALEGDVPPVTAFKTGVRTRWIGGDLRAFLALLRISEKKLKFTRQYFFPSKSAALLDDFRLDDPMPFIAWCLDACSKMLKHGSTQPVMHDSLKGVWE